MGRVEGKVALVTGGASGIGKATAAMLGREGGRVVVTDLVDRDSKSVTEEIGNGAIFLKQDVTDESQWEEVMAQIRDRFGKLDILVNCAGITGKIPQYPENSTLDSWRQVMSVNMEGVFLGCKHAIPLMKESIGGSIVNIASYAGIVGVPMAIAYGASKAGVSQFSKSVALYCTQQGYKIRCNAILPGAVLTPIWESFFGSGEQLEQHSQYLVEQIPLKVWGEPNDVAYAVLYLASDESKFVTGVDLIVDGGQSAVF